MICKPSQLNFNERKLSVIIAGVPGIGKTTLGLSAPKPLLIDIENGCYRVEAKYRTDTLIASSFAELKQDLSDGDLTPYETIVIDTGGKLLEMLKPVVISKDPKNGKKDGNLSLQGYGAVKREFSAFINFIKSLNKNIVLIFHATEVNLDGDTTGLRIRVEGSTRDDVWDDIDIGGFIEMNGKKRTIGFSNCDRYYAKGTHGIHGIFDIPDLSNGGKNDFLTKLFNQIKADLQAETEEVENYNKVVNGLKPVIAKSTNLTDLNNAYKQVATAKHYLTSKDELWFQLNEKAKELKCKYDKQTNSFILDNTKSA